MHRFMKLSEIQPSQLYVSSEKLSQVITSSDNLTPESMGPIPVKELAGRVVATDGHTRLLAAFLAGLGQVKVCWDGDGLDWEAYEICASWCQQEGVRTAADLADRIVPPAQYETLWLDRCRKMHRELEARRKRGGSRSRERGAG